MLAHARCFIIVAALTSLASNIFAQGCVCAHLVTPGLNAEGAFYIPAGDWSVSSTFRYYNARQDVLGDHPLRHALVYADTHVYETDFSTTYAVTDRFDLSLEGSVQYGERKTWVEHDFNSMKLHTMAALGAGNVRLFVDGYIFEPRKSPDRNVSLGIGVEIPVGQDDAKDYSYRANGRRVLRPVDPAIQPAQGGWGILGRVHAYTTLYFPKWEWTSALKHTFLYLDGLYDATPQEFSGTQTVFGDEPELTLGLRGFRYDSLVDQFLVRGGVSQMLWPSVGLSAAAGLRFEGVPSRDLIGKSDGFRLPGNNLSFEPSLTLVRGKQSFSVSVPISIRRYAANFEANEKSGSTGPSFDTIADWQLIVSYTREF